MRIAVSVFVGFLLCSLAPAETRIFVAPDADFGRYVTRALDRKHVPAAVVDARTGADFEVRTGDSGLAILDLHTGNVVFDYETPRRWQPGDRQKAANACAVRLRAWLLPGRVGTRSKFAALFRKNPAFDF